MYACSVSVCMHVYVCFLFICAVYFKGDQLKCRRLEKFKKNPMMCKHSRKKDFYLVILCNNSSTRHLFHLDIFFFFVALFSLSIITYSSHFTYFLSTPPPPPYSYISFKNFFKKKRVIYNLDGKKLDKMNEKKKLTYF